MDTATLIARTQRQGIPQMNHFCSIHRSAWKENSPKLSETFQELYGFLGPQPATVAPRLDGVPEPEPLLRVSHVRDVVSGTIAV